MRLENRHTRGSEYGVWHFKLPKDAVLKHDENLVAEIYKVFCLSRQLSFDSFQELVDLGSVYINEKRFQKLINLDLTTQCDKPQLFHIHSLRIHSQPRRCDPKFLNFDWQQFIRFKHPDFYVVQKPAPLDVHAQVDNLKENLIYFLELYLNEELFITNRLDRETSGLIILARNKNFQSNFNALLRDEQVKKTYQALVWGLTDSSIKGLKTHFMKDSTTSPKEIFDLDFLGAIKCELKILNSIRMDSLGVSLLDVELITGRTNQIRAQLKKIGYSILGDKVYAKELNHDSNYLYAIQKIKKISPNFTMGLFSKSIEFEYQNTKFLFDSDPIVPSLFE